MIFYLNFLYKLVSCHSISNFKAFLFLDINCQPPMPTSLQSCFQTLSAIQIIHHHLLWQLYWLLSDLCFRNCFYKHFFLKHFILFNIQLSTTIIFPHTAASLHTLSLIYLILQTYFDISIY